MRARLLLVLAILGAVVVMAFAVPLAVTSAEARTREFVASREADLRRFTVLAEDYVRTGEPGQLMEEIDAYHQLYGEGVVVVSTRGVAAHAVGASPADPPVAAAVDRALRNQDPAESHALTPWGSPTRVMAQPVGSGAQVDGAVVVVASTEQVRADIATRWAIIGGGVIAALALFGVLASSVSRWVLRPLDRLSGRLQSVTAGLPFALPPERRDSSDDPSPGRPRSDPRIAAGGPPELRALADSFETMAEAVEHSSQAQHRLIADTAHQLRNPLAALQLRLDTLEPLIPEHGHTGFDRAMREANRLRGLLDDMLTLSAAEAPRSSRVRAQSSSVPYLVAADRIDFWFDTAQRRGVRLQLRDSHQDAVAAVRTEDLEQMLDVLLDNASKYGGEGTTVTVSIDRGSVGTNLDHSDSVMVDVVDNGAGVPPEELSRLSQRFFRSETTRTAGTGLGLAIVEALTHANSGRLEFAETPGGGLTARVSLPAARSESPDDDVAPAHTGERTPR